MKITGNLTKEIRSVVNVNTSVGFGVFLSCGVVPENDMHHLSASCVCDEDEIARTVQCATTNSTSLRLFLCISIVTVALDLHSVSLENTDVQV